MSNVGLKLKVLTGEHQGKVGVVIEVNEDKFDSNGNFQQSYQVVKFPDGKTDRFPLYQISMLQIVAD